MINAHAHEVNKVKRRNEEKGRRKEKEEDKKRRKRYDIFIVLILMMLSLWSIGPSDFQLSSHFLFLAILAAGSADWVDRLIALLEVRCNLLCIGGTTNVTIERESLGREVVIGNLSRARQHTAYANLPKERAVGRGHACSTDIQSVLFDVGHMLLLIQGQLL